MNFESQTPLSEEEKAKTLSRMISDGKLAKDRAIIRDDGSLEVTIDQKKQARIEMESEQGFYHEYSTMNGIKISVDWDKDYQDYTIYFPDIEWGEKMEQHELSDQTIIISGNRNSAKQVYDYACQAAQTENDVYNLYHQVEKFVRTLPQTDTD